MPKLIDYPRTSYTSAWEVAEVVDDTGGKCALETCARKLNRKVSGSFKAIVGSAVKFGLLTSKRELLTTTTLFRRIKHAYDKQEELLFHREAFLTPALFAQICRKFRNRELPVAMLDVLLIREFDVEEINAQSVAKAFVDGARMVGVLDEHNLVADIDQLSARQAPRRELANPTPINNTFRSPGNTTAATTTEPAAAVPTAVPTTTLETDATPSATNLQHEHRMSSASGIRETVAPAHDPTPTIVTTASGLTLPSSRPAPSATSDAVAALFNLNKDNQEQTTTEPELKATTPTRPNIPSLTREKNSATPATASQPATFRLQVSGPGVNTDLEVTDADDLALVRALLDKIERQLRRN